jgi:hypothetical protein
MESKDLWLATQEMNMVDLGPITALHLRKLILHHTQMAGTGIIMVISMEAHILHPLHLGDATTGRLPED